jgi:hypothetical protein
MRDIKFVLYSEQNLPAQDRELLAYEIRAHVARHTHSVRQQQQYEKSRQRQPQVTCDRPDGDGPLSLVAPPSALHTDSGPLVDEGSNSTKSDVLPTGAQFLRPYSTDHDILIPQSAPGRRSCESWTQRPAPVLGSLPLIPISHNDLMLPSEVNLMLSKGLLMHSPATSRHD